MKQHEVVVGQAYIVRVSGRLVRVRIVEKRERDVGLRRKTCWVGRNESTGRTVLIRSAARLRQKVGPVPGSRDNGKSLPPATPASLGWDLGPNGWGR